MRRASIWINACLSCTLSAASPADTPASLRRDLQILDLARAANDDVYSSLQSFVCSETIHRFQSLNGLSSEPRDTVTARLSFERGTEQYSNIKLNSQSRSDLTTIPGAWSEGEFGTLLLQTQKLLLTQKVTFDSFEDLHGEQTARYHFAVTVEDSPWDLAVAGRHYQLPFSTELWISARTGEILKIDRVTTSVASETLISEIQWGITLEHFSINGKTWLLPATGSYAVLYKDSTRREVNQISFTGYQRYGSETALKFE